MYKEGQKLEFNIYGTKVIGSFVAEYPTSIEIRTISDSSGVTQPGDIANIHTSHLVAAKLFFIQNENAGFLGNSPIWWGLNRAGYTANLDAAEQFTEEEAREICLGNPTKNKAWPVEYILSNKGIQRIVDDQYLDSDNIVLWQEK